MLDEKELITIRVEYDLYDKLTSWEDNLRGERINDDLYEITLPIKKIFNLFNITEYDTLFSVVDELYVKTPRDTWEQVKGLFKKKDNKLKLMFNKGREFVCGKKHAVQTLDGVQYAIHAKTVFNNLTRNFETIENFVRVSDGDVMGITISEPYLYVTTNGFTHRSSKL